MIRKYKVKNFGPFRNWEEIDFIARKKSESNKHLLLSQEILPVIVFYGPNGAGKTSFIDSINFLRNLIINPLENNLGIGTWNSIEAYTNLDSKEKNIEFYIEFEDDKNIYEYYLNVSRLGLEQEFLSIKKNKKGKKELIFNLNKNFFNRKYIPGNLKIENKNKKTTLLNFFNFILEEKKFKKVFQFFENIIYLNQDVFSSKDIMSYNNFINRTAWKIIEEEKKKVIKIFNDVDINIKDIIIEKNPLSHNIISRIFFQKNSSFGEGKTIDAFFESSGTLKFLSIISYLLYGIKKGCLFLIDELDSGLHTLLLKYVILLFKNNDINQNMSQLVFSSHDLSTLNSEVFRRDEVYFAAMNESYFSNVISLSDLMINDKDKKKVRNDHNYAKLYLEGKLGYDPYIDYSMKGFKSE